MRTLICLLLAPLLLAQHLPYFVEPFLPKTSDPVVLKVDRVLSTLTSGQPRPYSFVFTQAEATRYLKEVVRANPGCGVSNPDVRFLPDNHVSLSFDVDIDQLIRFRPNWTSRLRRLPVRGRHAVAVEGRFWTGDGVFTAQVEKARIDGHYVSPTLLNLGIRFLARWKDGRLNVVRGIPMPWGLKRLVTASGTLSGQA